MLLETLKSDMYSYIYSLNLTKRVKDKIYNIYLNYINEKHNIYSSINYEDENVYKIYLQNADKKFQKRLNIMINTPENAEEYVSFILKNKYGFNVQSLNKNDKELYNTIIKPSFDIYKISLMYDNINYNEICRHLHYLAVKFGYSDDIYNEYKDRIITYNDLNKIPDVIKEAIKGVEK